MRTHAITDSPVGPLTLVDDGGALAGLYMGEQKHLPETATFGPRDDTVLPALQAGLEAYFEGALQEFTVPLAPVGTPFQQEVWSALRAVPYGTTTTYGALAARLGRTAAVRAVGAAIGRNPIGIVVPCHRVVGASGSLTGYAGGLDRKRHLLDLERGVLSLV